MATLGKTSIGGTSANTANYVGCKFTATQNGVVPSMTVYTKAAAGSVNVGFALYSDVAGQPTTRLAVDDGNISVDTTPQWVTGNISYNIVAGTTYWLFFWASGSHTIYWDAGASNQYYVNGGTFENWPATESAGSFFAREVSIYVTYTVAYSGLAVEIDGVDRSLKVLANTLKISNILTNKRDTCDFTILNHTGETFLPALGSEVVIYDSFDKIFGGIITEIESSPTAFNMVRHEISCQDYTRLLDHRLVPDIFRDETVDDIIAFLAANYFPAGFTTDNVDAPVNISYVSFKYKPLSKCIQMLADMLNYDWYVDYDKDVHFFAKDIVTSPFDLTDTNGKYRYNSLIIRRNNSQVRNSIIVRGGEYLAAQLTTNIETTGVDAIYPLAYRYSDFAAHLTGEILSVGIDGIDNPDNFDALHNFNEKIIRFKEADKPSSGKTLKVSGKPNRPVIVKTKSQPHIDAMISAEGGDGVYEYLIEDKSINSIEGARQRANAEILAYATTLSEGEFTTETSGLRAGQKINIQSTSRNIDEDFVINKVIITQFSPNTLLYQISLITTRTFDLIDVLQRLLLQSTNNIEIDENEVVQIIHDFTESFEMIDSVSAPTTSTGPYKYDSALWNLSKWA